MKFLYRLTVIALLGQSAVLTAQAQEKVILRVAHQFPNAHSIPTYGIKPWMELVTKLTNGEVQFQYYPAEQLGKAKDMFSLVKASVADVVLFAAAYTSETPLSTGLELPGMFRSSCQGTSAYRNLAQEGGLLDRLEYEPNGVRLLLSVVYPPDQFMSMKQSIHQPKEIQNLKIRAPGAARALAMRKLNVVPINISSPDALESLRRGTIDGAIYPLSSILSYDIRPKYVTVHESFGTVAIGLAINRARFAQLSVNTRNAMTQAGDIVSRSMCKSVDKGEADAMEKLREMGTTIVEWSPADHRNVEARLISVSQEWAQELDKRGRLGSETLQSIHKARDQQQ